LRQPESDELTPIVANVGCGPRGSGGLPAYFERWRELRVDVDPSVQPDIIGDLTDLSAISDNSLDALWASHCVEHLYAHQVPKALREFHRVLKSDGFACILVPDLQTVANLIVADRLHEPMYQSAAGPITPHDVFFGYGNAIAAGRTSMAHRCGFTPTLLMQHLEAVPFADAVIRRRPTLELAAIVRKTVFSNPGERDSLLAALNL
jgi:SAM-dependent methyltransferase